MKIAVYSGSFNPLHIGHRAIISHLTEKMDFDKVYLIVSPKNPLKENIREDSARARYEAACQAIERNGLDAMADDIELSMPSPQYSIRTLDALSAREPQNTFTLVIGADNLAGFRKWKDYRRILSEYGVVVFPREGHDLEALRADLLAEAAANGTRYGILLAEAPLVTISSTEIREGMAAGKDMSAYLI